MSAASFRSSGIVCKRGEVEDHKEPRLFPDCHDDDRPKRGFRLAQPVHGRQAKQAADLVQHTKTGGVKEQPQVRGSDHRQHGRCEIGGAHKAARADFAIRPKRHRQRDEDGHGDRDARVKKVVFDHDPECRIGKQLGVVFSADEFGGLAAGAAGKQARPQGRDRRVKRKQRQQTAAGDSKSQP